MTDTSRRTAKRIYSQKVSFTKSLIAKKAKAKEEERKTTYQKSEKSNMVPVNTAKELANVAGVSHGTIRSCAQIVFQTAVSSFVRWKTPINDYRAFSTPMQHQTSSVFTTQKENPHKYNVETTIA